MYSSVSEDSRKIMVGKPLENLKFCSNKVVTARYSWWSWGPKSLIMQFTRINNVYFLAISILSLMSFSPKSPWSLCGTFGLVLLFTMFKEAYEDISRHRQDNEVNSQLVLKYSVEFGFFVPIKSQDIKVGDIIKILENEAFPADLLLISCSHPKGIAFVNTMNLDGESNLKEKYTIDIGVNLSDEKDLALLQAEITTDKPNNSLVKWNCKITVKEQTETVTLKQFLLRGCFLKNTEWVYGIAVYTGHDSKIVLNSKKAPTKRSSIQKTMNWILVTVFIFQLSVCFIFAGIGGRWLSEHSYITYIDLPNNNGSSFIISVLVYWIAYSHLIPISLYVTLEIVKLFLANFIKSDQKMYYEPLDRTAQCRASDLIEELGQVEFIFSDKTGTLTCNEMQFRKCLIGSIVYGSTKNSIETDPQIINVLSNTDHIDHEAANNFLKCMAVCNTVFPVKHDNETITYQASSPDELALVEAAKALGYDLQERSGGKVYVNVKNEIESWEILVEIPFNSDRKRMSIIARDPRTKKLMLMTKGADTMMSKLIKDKSFEAVQDKINQFASEGLRTLVLASKALKESEFSAWYSGWKEIQLCNSKDKDEMIDRHGAALEVDLDLVGITAIEDKLQQGVPETIKLLMEANIRIWVLTGDKEETAIEIAKSCNLFQPSMEIYEIFAETENAVKEKIEIIYKKCMLSDEMDFKQLEVLKRNLNKPIGIVINGISIAFVMEKPDLMTKFFKLGFISNSCVCCRVSPSQKMHVVRLCRSHGNWVSLAIGDGANDVSMIQEAHIGVGIAGKEGTQAVQASEFAFCQFRFLERLLLVHGRYAYFRISIFILYYFYKNCISVFTEVWFAFYAGYSGQIYFLDWLPALYNTFWTSWPCLTFLTLEQDVNPELSLLYPKLYFAGQRSANFNVKIFWRWIAFAIHSATWIFWLPVASLSQGSGSEGHEPSLFWISTVSFIMLLHTVNIKLMMISFYWTKAALFTIFISFAFFYVMTIVLNTNAVAFAFQPEFPGLFYLILAHGKTWVLTVLGSSIALFPDFLYTFCQFIYFPTYSQRIVKTLKKDSCNA